MERLNVEVARRDSADVVWHEANRMQFSTGTNLKPVLRQMVKNQYCTACNRRSSCKLSVHVGSGGRMTCLTK